MYEFNEKLNQKIFVFKSILIINLCYKPNVFTIKISNNYKF